MKRLDLKVGFICNNNCIFCVQAHKKRFGDKSTELIIKEMELGKKTCQDIVFTGGEVTIRKDFFEIVKHAKKIGYKGIQIQSNGRMFSNIGFCKKTIEAGATEFSPALHGYCDKQHDMLTNAKGSFNQTVNGIINLKKLGQKVLTNTVVVKQNYKDCDKIANLLVGLGVDQYQLAFVHPMGNAYDNFEIVVPKISDAAKYIHAGIEVGIKSGVKCMVEAIPFCHMKGYEVYMSENYIPETEVFDLAYHDENYTETRINDSKVRFDNCKICNKYNLCEGIWKEYPDNFGKEEFESI